MILGKDNLEIVKKAVEYQSEMTDGVVQYDYKTDELIGAGFTTGTVENPANPVIEVFRLRQGESLDLHCWENGDCPFADEDGHFDEEMVNEDGETRLECCAYFYAQDDFEDDFENNFRDGVEEQVRDVLKDHLWETIDKLDDIRLRVLELTDTPKYLQELYNNRWNDDVLDNYVDFAMNDGFTTSVDAIAYLDAEVEYVCGLFLDIQGKHSLDCGEKATNLIRNGNLDGALELLQ